MIPIRTPRAATKVCSKGARFERIRDGMFEHEIIHHIMRRRVRCWGCKAEDFYGTVVTRGCEVFVRGVEGDALDVTLVHGKGLQLLERMA